MLAANRLFTRTIETIYGPYRKRWNTSLSIESRGFRKPTERSHVNLQDARETAVTVGNASVRLSGSDFLISVSNQTKIEILGLLGWRMLWDGNRAPLTTEIAEFRVKASEIVRIRNAAGEQSVFAIIENRPSLLSALRPSRAQLRGALSWILRTFESGVLHGALIGLVLLANGIDFSRLTSVESIEEVSQPAQTVSIPVEVVAQVQQSGEYDGHTIATNPTTPLTTAEKVETETSKLAKLAAQISRIALPNLNIGNLVVSAVQKDGAAVALKAGLSASKATDLAGQLKKLSGGQVGERMKWSLYGEPARELSLKDQDQVVQLFRSLQPNFRDCYDNALLKDEELSVSVQYEALVTASGALGTPAYLVVGRSTSVGERMLKECLTNVLSRAKVSKNLSGVKIKNEFVFRS